MNIVTPIPTTFAFPTANINTEAARRDNLMRETIPQSAGAEQGAKEQGVGKESDKAKAPGQPPAPVTYERPQNASQSSVTANQGDDQLPDNAEDESAGKENAEQQQEQQAQQKEVEQLRQRDQEVRTHEQAHASIGGQYAGSPSFDYTRGPDGVRYATDGEVSIDISKEATPEQTVRKMQQVRAAALAPAEPSPADLQVASEAGRIAFEARQELAEQNRVSAQPPETDEAQSNPFSSQTPSLEEIVKNGEVSTPTRTLTGLEINQDAEQTTSGQRTLDIQDEQITARIGVIQRFYQQATQPSDGGFSVSA